MTATQLAEELNLSTHTVYHHLQKLKNADLVAVVREERVGHLIESYYRATAEVFDFTIGESRNGMGFQIGFVRSIVDALTKIGFDLEYNESTAQEIVNTEKKITELSDTTTIKEKVSKLDDTDFFLEQRAVEVAKSLTLSDKAYGELTEARGRIRELYLSMSKTKKRK
jgi:DNA-binding transcriptional regulator GbsR (MarR family)